MADEKRPAEESTTEVDAPAGSPDATPAPVADPAEIESDTAEDSEVIEEYDLEAEDSEADEAEAAPRSPMSHVKVALIAGLVGVLALAGLTAWMGYRTYEANRDEHRRELFLQVGRQGALNLTTIDWQNAEADVQRILDSATGTFYDDFQQRAQPFVEVVKQAQSKSVGTVAEAGLESAGANEAQVLVAVTVKTSNAGAPEQEPRAWRMRISVEKIGDDAKVSNVEFVP
ncbi:Mce protein [Mycolicibacterium austroafricanum]|uniref:Mce protein n=1 Tax=Mycolicibacterium austroafricanum TaxID=39687 RepID=A0ABT8HP58_MYCAO|nr:Mce protein [Mycolicibacterium austroafricanum]MDN4522554.1 Mce protein [Mycolicibacterium austroafricanum]QRZ05640.1 Mce protein [Mycolicibacterium austroafricanum]QZT67198.1 Mce protein [Mycolicibacterium austroafricanum]